MTKIILRLTCKEDSFIPYGCKVYLVEHKYSVYMYITSKIHNRRLCKSSVSYSLKYLRARSILLDSHYIALVSRFK